MPILADGNDLLISNLDIYFEHWKENIKKQSEVYNSVTSYMHAAFPLCWYWWADTNKNINTWRTLLSNFVCIQWDYEFLIIQIQ